MYKILAVDDAKDTLMLLEFDLADEGYQVVTAMSGEAALNIIKEQDIDLILLDMYMPGLSGLATLEKIKSTASGQKIPVIMLSASNDEDEIVAALELGADDYVTKPYIAKVLLARMRTSLRLLEKTIELERLANTDFLTGINNRGSFEDLASKAISQCERNQQSLALAMFDIDFFKKVNDVYGHEAGDKVLIEFSQVLGSCFRAYDIVGRIGGEEFAVCMPNVDLSDAHNACERLRLSIENKLVDIGNEQINVTVSIGLTLAQNQELELSDILKDADLALYQAKSNGRNQVVLSNVGNEVGNEVGNQIGDVMDGSLISNEIDTAQDESGYPGIDHEVGVANVLGDNELFKQILEMFYDDHSQDSAKISQAIDSNDHDSIKHLVHTLKGVACSVGAMQLFELAKSLDEAVNRGDLAQYPPLFEPVRTELDKIMKGIENNR
ncbi:diguanylate cyclase [Thalassotalea sp. PLHSN55]|uniref:diguanylate cyclase n=1 Tax=Thalassotalea sp. PLHSN55 TaxID=3435888 RepID=UPI003F853017